MAKRAEVPSTKPGTAARLFDQEDSTMTHPSSDAHSSEEAEVIPFPRSSTPGRRAEDEVLEGEIVTPPAAPARAVEVRVRPATVDAMAAAARMAGQRAVEVARRPDRLVAAVVRHEVVYGTLGAGRAAGALWRWVTAAELAPHLATNPKMVLEARRTRQRVALGAGGGIAVAGAVSWMTMGPAVPVVALLLALAVLGAAERKIRATGEEGSGRAALGTHPGSKAVRRAVAAAKLGKFDDIRIIGPVLRVDGAWQATVELPPGVTYRHAAKRRGELASAIGVDEVQVALDPVRGHHGRVLVWVADEDPMQGDAVASPLATRTTPVDLWTDRVFAGRDARGRAVEFSLVERSYLIGGEPGGGKSVASSNILAFAALDPQVQIYLADGKYGFDLAAWEPLAHHVVTEPGHDPVMEMLEEVRAEMVRRYALLRKIGATKVTAEIARRHGLRPILLHLDEIQAWSASGDTKADKAFIALIADIVGRGRAAGIITGAVTQRPAAEVVPTRLRDILSIRWALRCTTPDASDTILGAGRAGMGYNAALFNAAQRGAGYLLAEGAEPVQLRAAYLSETEVAGIARRAYALREEAGTLPKTADRPQVRLLTAVLEAMGDHPKGAHTADLLPRLHRTGEYAGWDAARLAAALKPLGVAPVQLDINGRNRNGYRRADVAAALERV